MIKRFEEFVHNIESAHKSIVKIKAYEMNKFGLKGAYVMCLYFLGRHPEGLIPSELCELCNEDKAGISKSLAALKKLNYITADESGGKKYRIKYKITDSGKEVYEKINALISGIVKNIGSVLSDEERVVFYKALGSVVTNLRLFSEELTN